jgi:hypothetical protein
MYMGENSVFYRDLAYIFVAALFGGLLARTLSCPVDGGAVAACTARLRLGTLFNAETPRLRGTMRVDLDPIPCCGRAFEQCGECHSVPDAGIKRRELRWEREPMFQTSCLGGWEREKTQLGLAEHSHRMGLLRFPCWRL